MPRKKKPEKKPHEKAPTKSAHEWTTDEAISRLFPKPLVDAARRAVLPPLKPPKSSIGRG